MLEDDEASIELERLCERGVEGGLIRDSGDCATMDTPVVRIPLLSNAVTVVVWGGRPEGGNEVHGLGDCTNTVVDVTVRGTEEDGGDASDVFDRLATPTELGNNLLVGQGSEGGMGPGVDA